MKRIIDCTEKYVGQKVAKTEKGKTIVLQSPDSFSCDIVKIDGCVFEERDGKKCDWLFLFPKMKEINEKLGIEKPTAFFVELKGTELSQACKQLYYAIDRTKSQIHNYDIKAKVISIKGQQPEIVSSEFYRKTQRLIGRNIEIDKVHKGNSFTHIERIN